MALRVSSKSIFVIVIGAPIKKSLTGIPKENITVNTGYLKVSSPEVTAMDLLRYTSKSGGLNHIVTVLSELIESIDPDKLLVLVMKRHGSKDLGIFWRN